MFGIICNIDWVLLPNGSLLHAIGPEMVEKKDLFSVLLFSNMLFAFFVVSSLVLLRNGHDHDGVLVHHLHREELEHCGEEVSDSVPGGVDHLAAANTGVVAKGKSTKNQYPRKEKNAFYIFFKKIYFLLYGIVRVPEHDCVSVPHLVKRRKQLRRQDAGDALQETHGGVGKLEKKFKIRPNSAGNKAQCVFVKIYQGID